MAHSHVRLTKFAHLSKLDKCHTEVIYTPVTEAGHCQNPRNVIVRNVPVSKLPIGFQSIVSLTFVVYMLTAVFLDCELLIKQALLWWRMWWDFEELPICAPAGMGKADAWTSIVALVESWYFFLNEENEEVWCFKSSFVLCGEKGGWAEFQGGQAVYYCMISVSIL